MSAAALSDFEGLQHSVGELLISGPYWIKMGSGTMKKNHNGSGSSKMTGGLTNLPTQHEGKQVKNKRFFFFFSYIYLLGPPLDSSVHILCVSSKFNWTFQEKFLTDTPRGLSVNWCQRQLRWKPRWTITQIKCLLVSIRRQELLRYSEK